MLFGFAGAIIAGFLLTAVPNWTAQPTPKGFWLALVFALWLGGRIAVLCSAHLPWMLVSAIDVSFFLVCAAAIAPALFRARNQRNYLFIALLITLALANALTYSQASRTGIRLALAVITLMLVIIGGRVIPFFTERRLGITISPHIALERWVAATTGLALLLDVFAANKLLLGFSYFAAALCNMARFIRWQRLKTMTVPLLWVLHLGYGWLILSFFLHAGMSMGFSIPPTIATHALTAGAIGTLILGMISRVSLGHTGRPLEVGKIMVIAFATVNIAALCRVFGVWVFPSYTPTMIWISAALWLLTYGSFLWIYTPILIGPRVDGGNG